MIEVSSNCSINSFNGDMITTGDYNETYYEYNQDGTENKEKVLEVLEKVDVVDENKKKFIPAKIFAQDGIIRAVYANYEYMSEANKKKYNLIENNLDVKFTSSNGLVRVVKIVEERKVESFGQGIGSGAGYIEVSNGTYIKF